MQPYFLPYIGYFQLIAAVDRFVIYDNIKYTKKGWINRNRMLLNGSDTMFSLPIRADSDALDVCQRKLSEQFDPEKLLRQFDGAYRRAPHFAETFPLLQEIVRCPETNLFGYIHRSVGLLCRHLDIRTEIVVSSTLKFNHSLRAQDKVIAICKQLGATRYINSIGGTTLYAAEDFKAQGLSLAFLKPRLVEYRQSAEAFVPWLSIVDLLMFNPLDQVKDMVRQEFDWVS